MVRCCGVVEREVVAQAVAQDLICHFGRTRRAEERPERVELLWVDILPGENDPRLFGVYDLCGPEIRGE